MSSETSIVQTVPVDEGLTLAECLHQVYEFIAVNTDDDISDKKSIPAQDIEPDAAYAYLQKMLGITKEQVSLFAVIFELALDGRTDAGSISKTLGVTRTKFLTFKPDLDVLKEQRYINYCSSRIGSSNFFVPNHVINSIAKGERPKPENQTLSVSKFAGKLSSLFRDFYLSDWDFSELFDEIAYLYSHNQDNHLVKSYYAANLNNSISDYEQVLFSFLISKAICYSQRNFEFEDYARLFMDQDFTEIKWNIEKGQLKLMQKGIVENASEGGQESADLIRLSEKALKEFIDQPTLEATGLLKQSDSAYFNLIKPNEITPKELYFNENLSSNENSEKSKNFYDDYIYTVKQSLFTFDRWLSFFPDNSKYKYNSYSDMSNMFYNCKSLKSLSIVSKFVENYAYNINSMFYNCESLVSLPDISQWNTEKINDMSKLFYNCKSLKSLPDISKWNTINVIDISYLFYNCELFSSLPDISKWNTKNIMNMNHLFYHCKSLLSLPDISYYLCLIYQNGILIILPILMVYFLIAHHYYVYRIYQNGILII